MGAIETTESSIDAIAFLARSEHPTYREGVVAAAAAYDGTPPSSDAGKDHQRSTSTSLSSEKPA